MMEKNANYKPAGLMDLFLTLDPPTFRQVAQGLSRLSSSDKKGFNLLLEEFERHKGQKPEQYAVETIRRTRYVHDSKVNDQLSQLLCLFWDGQTKFHGGYLKCMLPVRKDDEPTEVYARRYRELFDQMTSLYAPVLDDCDYFCQPLWRNK